jgi:hypothetical protein
MLHAVVLAKPYFSDALDAYDNAAIKQAISSPQPYCSYVSGQHYPERGFLPGGMAVASL